MSDPEPAAKALADVKHQLDGMRAASAEMWDQVAHMCNSMQQLLIESEGFLDAAPDEAAAHPKAAEAARSLRSSLATTQEQLTHAQQMAQARRAQLQHRPQG